VIELKGVSRWYGQVIGMNDVSCVIPPGVTALLGQNGAGKSTMMRIITGQIRPTTGEVKVDGLNPFASPECAKVLGFCPDIDSFPEHLNGRQFVERMGQLMGLSPSLARTRTRELLEKLGMWDRSVKPLRGYSKGMRQRIKLAAALIHEPKVLLLDEPLNGLDPVGRREFMDILHGLAEEGKTIIVSSHILFEVEQMTSSILLMHRGRLLASGNLRTIRELIDKHPHRIRVVCAQPRLAAARLAALADVESLSIGPGPDELEVRTKHPDMVYSEVARLCLDEGMEVYGLESPDNSLEAIFGYLVEAS
jgi:ABC-2 type transport system ATP-binding protein